MYRQGMVSIRLGEVLRGKGNAKLRTAKWRNVKRRKGKDSTRDGKKWSDDAK